MCREAQWVVSPHLGSLFVLRLDLPLEVHAIMEDADDFNALLVHRAEDDKVSWAFDSAGGGARYFSAMTQVVNSIAVWQIGMAPTPWKI